MTTQITSSLDNRPPKVNSLTVGPVLSRPAISTPSPVSNGAGNVSPDLLQSAVNEANKVLSQTRADLKLDIDSESKEVVIKIIEPSSGEIINQYPSKASLAIASAIAESQQQALDRRMAYQANSSMTGLIIKQKS